MTQTLSLDEAQFHAAQRARLCNPRQMPPLQGPWARALVGHLQRQLPGHFHAPWDQAAVVDCFAQAPDSHIERLFHAIGEASADEPVLDEPSAIWATELTVYAAMRSFDLAYLLQLPTQAVSPDVPHGLVMRLPLPSSTVAALALARLTGQLIRLDQRAHPRGVIALDDAACQAFVDPLQAVLVALYDEVLKDEPPRLNASQPLTEREQGQLRHVFDSLRLNREVAAPFILLKHLGVEETTDLCSRLAAVLNTRVVSGERHYDPQLVRKVTAFTVPSLQAKVEKVLKTLPYFVPQRQRSTPPAAPSAASAQTTRPASAAPVPTPPYTWDVFISHASEDKPSFVQPLAEGLTALGLRVWYDKHSLQLGDSLVDKIGEGLRDARFGIVVLSPHFFAKGWPQAELKALMADELNNRRPRLLPIWLNLDQAAIANSAPLLADRLAIQASRGLPAVLQAVLAAVQRDA